MIKERIINSISCKHKYVFIGEYGEDKTPLEKCDRCGSQRCDRSEEWMDACPYYKEWKGM